MKVSKKYELEIDAIQNDINTLLEGHYSYRLAEGLDKKFKALIKKIDDNKKSDGEMFAEKFGTV